MFHFIYDALDNALGLSLESHDLTWHQMALRALLTFIIILVIVRCAHKRFLGKATAFDVVLGILLGSIASRAITGNAPFFPALLSTAVLVVLHWLCAWISFRSPAFSRLVEGRPTLLARDGELLNEDMRRTDITREDLLEALRGNGIETPDKVKLAYLERNGKISSVSKD